MNLIRLAFLALFALPGIAPAQSSENAQEHLDRALRLANAYNWADAGPDFVEAERLFSAQQDAKNAYYAHLGTLRSTQHGAVPDVILKLADDLDGVAFLRTDPRLRMFCLIVKGDFDGESDHAAMGRDWNEVRQLASELGDKQWEFRATAQLGIAAYYNGDLAGARQNVANALMASHGIGDKPGEMLELAILANGLNFAALYGQAIPFADQSIKLAGEQPEIGFPYVAYQAKLAALVGLQRLETAQQLADEVLDFARKHRANALVAGILNQSARIARLRKDDDRALQLLDESVNIAAAGGYLDTLSEAQSLLADMYVSRKDLAKAEVYAAQSAESAQARGDFVGLPDRLSTLARIQVEQGKFTDAEQVFSRADAFVDSLVGRSEGVLDKVALLTAASDLYRRHFALIAEHFNDPRRAYDVIEQVRGRVMTDLLSAGSFTSPDAEAAAKQTARVRLKLMAARSNSEVQRIRDQLFVMEQARWVTPDVSILKANSGTRVNLETVQRRLAPSTVILEYVIGDPHSYCLAITRTSARIVRLAGGSSIDDEVARYLKSVKAKQAAPELARALYKSLLRPVREVTNHNKLVIVRDGQLHLLPFDALTDGGDRYIAETKIVSYSASASAFYLVRQPVHTSARGGALLGVGAIPYDSNTAKKATALRGYDLAKLANLPESKNEVIAAANAISPAGNTLLLGPEATESAFKKQHLDRYRVLHLAVHALVNTAQPDQAALIMLSDPAAGEDGFLHASEVVHLKLNAELAVLSACDTAVGPVGGEEGIATLSRAFLLAGTRTVISTLWSIEDLSSFVLMRQFYAHLAQAMPADVALAEAKRDVIQKFGRKAQPYYWAAFTLEGAGDQTVLRRPRKS